VRDRVSYSLLKPKSVNFRGEFMGEPFQDLLREYRITFILSRSPFKGFTPYLPILCIQNGFLQP